MSDLFDDFLNTLLEPGDVEDDDEEEEALEPDNLPESSSPRTKVEDIQQTTDKEVKEPSTENALKVPNVASVEAPHDVNGVSGDISEPKPHSPEPKLPEVSAENESKEHADETKTMGIGSPNEQQKSSEKTAAAIGEKRESSDMDLVEAIQSRRDMPVCFKNTFDQDFVQNRNKFGLQICSVIVFDVLKLGDRVFHRHDSSSAIFPTMKRVVVSKQNIRDMYKLEAVKRSYYRKKLNRILKKERLGGSSGAGVAKKPRQKGTEEKKSGHNKHAKDTENLQPHQRKHHDQQKTRPVEKFSAGGTRILPFERRYNESSQQIKRPKVEEPKISRALVGKQGLQKKEHSKQPQKPIPGGSFRIPKRAEPYHDHQAQRHQPIVSTTPLANFAPRENLRFQQFRQNQNRFSRPRWATDQNMKSHNNRFNFKHMEMDNESSEGKSCGDESVKTPPPPISEVEFGPVVEGVTKLLETHSLELDLPPKDLSSDLLAHKCAWWFRTMEKDPSSDEILCPELTDQICQPSSIQSDDDDSFLGNVSNQGDDDDCQVNEISSTENQNPALTDEFCGAALLSAKFRVTAEKEDQEAFNFIFKLEQGTNYDKESFQAHCNICDELVRGKKQLGPHIRSAKHVINLKNLSLQIISAVDKLQQVKIEPDDMISTQSKYPTVPGVERNKSKESKEDKDKSHGNSNNRRKSGRRSRSPRDRDRDRRRDRKSPLELESQKHNKNRDPVDEFLAKTNRPRNSRSRSPRRNRDRRGSKPRSRSPKLFVKQGANEIFHEKLTLTAQGTWDDDMELRWTEMEKEEDALQKKFESRRKLLKEKPESHPSYASEWTDFWQKKYTEVEALGKDPERYDYVPEWKEYWSRQGKLLLQLEFNAQIEDVRLKYGMDISSLRKSNINSSRIDQGRPLGLGLELDLLLPPVAVQPVPMPIMQERPRILDDYTTRSMSISDNGTEELQRDTEKSAVTVNDIKSTWETLTGQRISQKVAGNSESSKSASSSKFEFDGFDLVQVLQLVSGLGDQLGILTPRVNEFHRKAESLELSKRRQSYTLLQSREFVSLIVQCRTRLTELSTTEDLTKQTLQTLNLCVHLLGMILETPSCRDLVPLCATQPIDKLYNRKRSSAYLANSTTQLRTEKMAIARLLASNVISLGKHTCTQTELDQMVYKLLQSISKDNLASIPKHGRLQSTNAKTSHQHEEFENPVDAVDRVVGTALPPLPTINVRAVSPPRASMFLGGGYYTRR